MLGYEVFESILYYSKVLQAFQRWVKKVVLHEGLKGLEHYWVKEKFSIFDIFNDAESWREWEADINNNRRERNE